MLRRVLAALPLARERVPELRMLAITGPRIDPASLPRMEGLEVRGYVHELWRLLAAADFAVVQGGLSTTMELVAAGTPFVALPLLYALAGWRLGSAFPPAHCRPCFR